jgi:hypothetical protein
MGIDELLPRELRSIRRRPLATSRESAVGRPVGFRPGVSTDRPFASGVRRPLRQAQWPAGPQRGVANPR